MAQRMVALCDGKYIGIESIYTVVNGQQINIPDKLKVLRAKSQCNQLFCPCGCGANLILVAGDRNLREQHFRLKEADGKERCTYLKEGEHSIDSKIVLKCWLEDKLQTSDIQTRVPISLIEDTKRRYEFSFLTQSKNIALSYCHERVNLSDEKFRILEENSAGIRIIYVLDSSNAGTSGQYPEGLMKVQERQGYCLFLEIKKIDYFKAVLHAFFYTQDFDGLWMEVSIVDGKLCDFHIDPDGELWFENHRISDMLRIAKENHARMIEEEKTKRAEQQKRFAEEEVKRQKAYQERLRQAEIIREQQEREAETTRKEAAQRKKTEEENREKEEERKRTEKLKQEEIFRNAYEHQTEIQQETKIKDSDGNRWVKCEFCGKFAKDGEFGSYGGEGRVNLGICKECFAHNPEVQKRQAEKIKPNKVKIDLSRCPECGGTLREKTGRYGRFMGCSNYPGCRFTRKM